MPLHLDLRLLGSGGSRSHQALCFPIPRASNNLVGNFIRLECQAIDFRV